MNIYQAMAAVMADVQSVGKNDRNQAQGFKFRGIDAVMNAVGPVLRKHGVIVVPELISVDYGTIEVGRERRPAGHARVVVAYHFYGPEGDSILSSVAAEAMDHGDKATAKAMSVAFRTCLLQALCLPTDDPDPDSESFERSEHRVEQHVPADDDKVDAWADQIRASETKDQLEAIAAQLKTADISDHNRHALLTVYKLTMAKIG